MKKTPFYIVVFLSLLFNKSQAQKPFQELAVSYGFWSNDYIVSVLNKQTFKKPGFESLCSDSIRQDWNIDAKNISLSWYFLNMKGTLLGISFTYEKQSGYLNDKSNACRIGNYSRNPMTLALETKIPYKLICRQRNYMSLGLGYTFGEEKFIYSADSPYNDEVKEIAKFAFMIRPFNFAIGNKVAFFVELGASYKGAASIGLLYRN